LEHRDTLPDERVYLFDGLAQDRIYAFRWVTLAVIPLEIRSLRGNDSPFLSDLFDTLSTWLTYRVLYQDYYLAVWAFRYSKTAFQVGLFAVEDHWHFRDGTAVREAIQYLFSQAQQFTGKMAIKFVGAPSISRATLSTGFEPEVPSAIRSLAAELGIDIADPTAISDEEGHRLFNAVCLDDALLNDQLGTVGINLTQAAMLLARGIWSKTQLAYIAAYCRRPNDVLFGHPDIAAAGNLLTQAEFLTLRYALMGERLLQFLGQTNALLHNRVEMRWTDGGTVECYSQREAEVDLGEYGGSGLLTLSPGTPTIFTLMPLNRSELVARFLCTSLGVAALGIGVHVLLADLHHIPSQEATQLLKQITGGSRALVVLIDTQNDMDREVRNRLRRSLTARLSSNEVIEL
jgi:hypothetical protein